MLRIILIFAFWFIFFSSGFTQELRDVKPPVAFPSQQTWIFAALLILFGLIAFLFWRFKLYPQRTKRSLSVSPWDLALTQLEQLQKQNLPAQGQVQLYYTLLSNILRHYIEDRFAIRAPEMTTEEFLNYVQRKETFNHAQQDILESFLKSCDLVKFAQDPSTPQAIEESFQLVKKFIDETKLVQVKSDYASVTAVNRQEGPK